MGWDTVPTEETITRTADAIRRRGIDVIVVSSGKEAFKRIMKMIPKNAEISNGSSTTLKQIGFVDCLKEGRHKWRNLHESLLKEQNKEKQADLRRKMVAAEYFLGSVNAISETGELVACDATGSRVSAYPFAAERLVLVAGTQKIVPTLEDAMKRVREYVYPLEDARMQETYGAHTSFGKWVIIEKELQQGRITLFLVKEKLGF